MILDISSLCKRPWAVILLILLAGILVYVNTFQAPFVFDDGHAIVKNEVIKRLENFYANSSGYEFLPNRYIAYLTLALNYRFGGLDVTGYHAVNLGIHLATALLVYALLRMTFRTPHFQTMVQAKGSGAQELDLQPSTFVPLFAALLFVVHPVQTQAVTYIVQRLTTLSAMFYLLSLVLYVKARLSMEGSGGRGREAEEKASAAVRKRGRMKPGFLLAGSVLTAVLAMKTKEIAFTLPLAAGLYELSFFRGPWKCRLLCLLPLLMTLPIVPLTVLNVGGAAGEILSDSGEHFRVGSSMSRLDYLFTQFRVIVTYLRLLIFPVNQNIDYDYPVYTTFLTPPVFLSFLLLAALAALAVYLFRQNRSESEGQGETDFCKADSRTSSCLPSPLSQPGLRLIAFGIFWFFLTLSVESSLVPIVDVLMEHRLYLPCFGAAASFITAIYLLAGKMSRPASGKILVLTAAILVVVFGFSAYQRNHVWGDAIQLWRDAVAKSPSKGRPRNNLGTVLVEAGRKEEAIQTLHRAIEVDPYYDRSYYNLADLYLVSDQPDKSLPLLQTAIQLNPEFTEAYVELGAALMRNGQFREVIQFLEKNFDRVGGNAEAHFYLGASHAFLGNQEAAMRELEIVSRLDANLAADLAGMLGQGSNHNSNGHHQ